MSNPVKAPSLDPVGQKAVGDAELASLTGCEAASLLLSNEVEGWIVGPVG
jgi:hypothetical protein